MMELQSQKDINKVVTNILKESKSFDVFPTPIDKIVEYTELAVSQNRDLTTIHESYLAMAGDALKRALGKLQGFLDRKEKVIYLDLDLPPAKHNFVKLHEVGHKVLPWQQSLFDALEEDDQTLCLDTKEEFEAEANFFASATFFQQDRFDREVDKLGLTIESSLSLAKLFGASIHATLRRYVEYSKKRCALIVLDPMQDPTKCKLRNYFCSEKFNAEFGDLKLPLEFGVPWEFMSDYITRRRLTKDGAIQFLTKNGNVNFTYHYFYNHYNSFVFIFPVGEKKSTRTRFIIQ